MNSFPVRQVVSPEDIVDLDEPLLEEFDPEEYPGIEREMIKELQYYLEPPAVSTARTGALATRESNVY